jgi:DNA-binding LacI/PurR family transcriptional regulator
MSTNSAFHPAAFQQSKRSCMAKPKPQKDRSENASQRRITMRDVAHELGLSHVTVSAVLRNRPGASDATRKRVIQKAKAMGYVPDPMLSALSLYRKSSRDAPIQATLAWINQWPQPEQLRKHKEFDLYWTGAKRTAKRLGFQLEEFTLKELPIHRLDKILKTRHIQGLLLSPVPLRELPEWQTFPWTDYATVCLSRNILTPKTHVVTSSQTANTMLTFDRIRKLGYQRIGFICEFWRTRYFGMGYSWAQQNLPQDQQLPPLILNPDATPEQRMKALEQWIRKTNPDAIITDDDQHPYMLKELGYRIPEDIGLATTSIHDTPIDAGINQNPEEIGCAAVRILVSLLNEQKFGLPEIVNEMLIEGRWVDGSMLPPKKGK